MSPFGESKPPIYLGRARRKSLSARAPIHGSGCVARGNRVNLLERYDYPIVGRFGGFDLGVRALRGEDVPSLYLSGACVYEASAYQTGPALVASLLDLLGSIPKQHATGEEQLDVRRKRLDDIRLELARPFEHEGRLLDLLTRQRELLKRLDLDKDEVGSANLGDAEFRDAA